MLYLVFELYLYLHLYVYLYLHLYLYLDLYLYLYLYPSTDTLRLLPRHAQPLPPPPSQLLQPTFCSIN